MRKHPLFAPLVAPPFARLSLLLLAQLFTLNSTAIPLSQLPKPLSDTPVLTATLYATHPSTPPPYHVTTLHILSTSPTPLKNIIVDWSLQVNGAITKRGTTSIPSITATHPLLVRLPLRLPDDTAGESFLNLRFHSTPATASQPSSNHPSPNPIPPTVIAEQQILIHPYQPHLTINSGTQLDLTDSNDIVTIHSPEIRISFNRQTGWLVHYEVRGIHLLDDTLGLKSNFWWPGYNDSAHGTPDSGWQTATREPRLQLFSNTNSTTRIIIRTEYTLPATASLLHLSYAINANGEMLITQQIEPDTTQPPGHRYPMPCFGMQWIFPPGYDSINTYGPTALTTIPTTSNFPTTPWIGLQHTQPPTPNTTDIPAARAAATNTGIRWCAVTDKNGNGLQFIADTSLLTESALHAFDSDFDSDFVNTSPLPTSRPQTQLSIDRSIPNTPNRNLGLPIPLPPGIYQLTYKVKPLISPLHS